MPKFGCALFIALLATTGCSPDAKTITAVGPGETSSKPVDSYTSGDPAYRPSYQPSNDPEKQVVANRLTSGITSPGTQAPTASTKPSPVSTEFRPNPVQTTSLAPAGQLDFTSHLSLPATADAKGMIDFLASLDKTMQDLLRVAGSPTLTQEEAARQARVLSDLKLGAAERLEAVSETRLHKEMALLAKMEALSHASGLGDTKSATILRQLASNSAAFESKLVAHQAAIVILGFELSDLAAGLTDASPILKQLDLILEEPKSLRPPDFHVCAQTLKVLQQHGLDEAYEKAKEKTIAAFADHPDPQLAMRLWYLQVGSTPEFTALNEAMNNPAAPIAEFQKALTAVENMSATQWTLGYLMQNFTNLEFSGQLEKVGLISAVLQNRLNWIKSPELRSDAESLVVGFGKRISTIGKPFAMEGLAKVPTGEVFDFGAFKGRLVLLDFWASWCGPCRAEFPNLRELYTKYHERGLEIVGVNVDELPEHMLNLLNSEPLPWLNVRAADPKLTGFKNPIASELGLTGIPFLMLIGTDGKVIAIHTRGLALSRLLEEYIPR